MSQPFDQEHFLCGDFLSLKDPGSPLFKLEGVDDELRLKESVNGFSVGQFDVTEKRNDGSLNEAKEDVDYHQEVRDTNGPKEAVSVRNVECGTPKADSEWKVPENFDVQAQEASKRQAQEHTESIPEDQLNIAQNTLIWEFLTCEDEEEANTNEQVQRSVDKPAPDDIAATQGTNTQKTPLWKFLTCQDPGREAVEVQMLETIERQAQGPTYRIPADQDTFAVEKTMLWEFLTCTPKNQTVETVEVQVQETGKHQVNETPECKVEETVDVIPTDRATIGKKNRVWNYVTHEDTSEQQVEETDNSLLWEFLTCKSQVQEILTCHLPETSDGQVLENIDVREQNNADNFRADQVEMAETDLFFDFLACQDLTLDDDPQLRRAIGEAPAPNRADNPQTQSDGNLAAGQVEATKKPNDGAIIEVKKVAENRKLAQNMKDRSKVSPKEKSDPPTSSQLATTPTESKLKVSVTTAEIRRWAETRDKRQIKAVYHHFGVNPKAVIRMEGQAAIPDPKEEDHVILKVEASTVSATDCLLRRGINFDMFSIDELPATPGSDVVGYIVKFGPKATSGMNDFTFGDRVAALVRLGGNARYISVPASDLVRVPRSCDSVQAVCMVSIFSTAYLSLKVISSNKPMFSLEGKKVLVVGGMDPVGQALIQMLTKAKADPVFVTAPEYHHTYIRSVLGAYPLPERAEEWTKYVVKKMDFVFDGECEDRMSAAHSALNEDGQVVCFGTKSYLKAKEVSAFGAPLYAQMPKTTNVDIWESLQKDRTSAKKHLTALFQLLKAKKIHARIARRISLAEVADAQARLEKEAFNGAVVCLPWKINPPRPEGGRKNPFAPNVGSL